MELGALVDSLREAMSATSDAGVDAALWHELAKTRAEVRTVFLVKFFEVR